MTRKQHFSECFWDKDMCGSSGFEALLRRLKDGRQMCKDVEEFLRTRAKIEEEYSKQLHRLAKNAGGNCEIGTLRASWDAVKHETEAMAHEHNMTHQALLEAAARVAEFTDKQKHARKEQEDGMKKSIKKKTEFHKRMLDSKKTYENKSREAENAREQLNAAQNAQYSNPKDIEKLESKCSKSRQDATKADTTYKHAVDLLEGHRKTWEKEMVQVCEEFEKLEEVRISWLRNELWVHTNIMSQLCVDNDEHCEEMRKTLEKCDVTLDLLQFIDKCSTGSERPERIPYQSYQGSTYHRPPAPLPVK